MGSADHRKTKAVLVGELEELRRRLHDHQNAADGSAANPQAESLYRMMFESSPNPTIFVDLSGNILDCNEPTTWVSGREKQDIIGRNLLNLSLVSDADREMIVSRWTEVQRGEPLPEPFTVEVHSPLMGPNWLEVHPSFLRGAGGIVGILIHTRNVTRQHLAEERLRESRELFRQAFDGLPVLVAQVDPDFCYIFANLEYARTFGLSPEEIVGRRVEEVIGPENFKRILPYARSAMAGQPVSFNGQLSLPSGLDMEVFTRYLSSPATGDGTGGYIVLTEDVTERNATDRKLKRELLVNFTLARLSRALIDPNVSTVELLDLVLQIAKELTRSGFGFVSMLNPEGQVECISLSRPAESGVDSQVQHLRREVDDSLALRGHQNAGQVAFFRNEGSENFVASLPASHPPVGSLLMVPARAGSRVVGQIVLAGPSEPYTDDDLTVMSRLADLFALAIDRIGIEQALKRSESRYRTLYEESPISIWEEDFSAVRRQLDEWAEHGITDLDGFLMDNPAELRRLAEMVRVHDVNEATAILYGAPDRQTLMQNLGKVLCDDSYEAFRKEIVALAGGATRFNSESINCAFDGTPRTVQLRLMVPEEARASLSRVIAAVIDVTESRRFQEALHKAAVEWRTTFDAMIDPLFIINAEHRITRVNLAAARLFGMHPEKVIGHRCWELIHPESGPGAPCIHSQTMISGNQHTSEHTFAGRVFFCSTSPVRDARGNLIASVHSMHDVTELKRIEEERLRSSKLESIGVLAGGIAHDFNNILMGIMGNLSMARMELEDEEDPTQSIDAAEQASALAKDLTRQLLTFSRGGAPVKTNASIREVIEQAVKFVAHGSNVRCALALSPDLGSLALDVGQISQVMHNIVLNAIQAMPGGGTVTVTAEKCRMDEGEVLTVPAGSYVRIAVSDHGIGIEPDVLPKIFDPYFTTKKKGTGLGLATSYSIISRHGGVITVDSRIDSGSTFTIYLPDTVAVASDAVAAPDKIISGSGRILVMDDEEIVLGVAARMLRRLGYEVETARDGAEAVEAYRQAAATGRRFDAVIMDLTVPGGMGGKDAIVELLKLDPNTRAIVASGYSNDPVMSDCRAYGFVGMVIKPYRVEDLGQILAAIIPPPTGASGPGVSGS